MQSRINFARKLKLCKTLASSAGSLFQRLHMLLFCVPERLMGGAGHTVPQGFVQSL